MEDDEVLYRIPQYTSSRGFNAKYRPIIPSSVVVDSATLMTSTSVEIHDAIVSE